MAAKSWIQSVIQDDGTVEAPKKLEAFSLRTATGAQNKAIRSLAEQVGFDDLRGFWKWLQSADLDYYDLIKIASPE